MESALELVSLDSIDVLLWLHTEKEPMEAEWDVHLETIGAMTRRPGFQVDRVRSLIVTDGGRPSQLQRQHLLNVGFEGRSHRASAVTIALNNPVLRGVGTILRWLNPGFRAYAVADVNDALRHLDVQPRLDELWPRLLALQVGLRPNETLRQIAERTGRPPPPGSVPRR